MFEGIGDIITTLFEGLDLRRRRIAMLGFIFVIGLCLLLFEQMTGAVYYNNLERKVELLKELTALEKEGGISSNPELKKIYDGTVQELNLRPIQPFNFPIAVLNSSVTFWKIISGAALGILLTIIAATQGESNRNNLIGVIMFTILCGFLGGLIPVIYNPWINYLGFPIAQLLFFLVIVRRANTQKSAV